MKILLPIIALALLIPLVLSLGLSPSPSITPSNPDTQANLVCSWGAVDATQINVSWSKNGVLNVTYNNIEENQSTILSTRTSRGEIWVCNVNITDGGSKITGSDTVTIENADPTTPVLYKNGTQQQNSTLIYEDSTYLFYINSTDPDGDTIDYENNGTLFDINALNTGYFTYTPRYNHVSSNIRFTLRDGQSPTGISERIFYFNITYVNDSPLWVTSITDQNATENQAFVYNIAVSDEENDPNNFSMSVEPALPSLVINKIDGFNANITFNRSGNTPIFGEEGNYTVNITVVDSTNTSRNLTSSFNLEVFVTNQIPVMVLIPNYAGVQNNNFEIYINATDADLNDTLSFSMESLNCALSEPWSITTLNTTAINGTARISLTLNNDHVVCPDVNISVTDSKGGIDYQEVNFDITNVNDAPQIFNKSLTITNTAGNNLTNLTGSKGARIIFSVNATDIDSLTSDGETLSFATNNSLFPINSNGKFNFTANESHVGNWTINVSVSDDEGLIAYANMNLNVSNNTIPIILNLTNSSCTEDLLCTITVVGYDPDAGSILTINSNTSRFSFTTKNNTAAVFTGTFNNSDVGNYTVLLTVNDEVNASSNKTVIISINNTNDAPFFDGDQDNVSDTINFSLLVETYNFVYVINVSDEDFIYGDTISFSYTNTSGNYSIFNLTQISSYQAVVNITPGLGTNGIYSFNVSVNDSLNNTAWQIVTFTIYNKSIAPVIEDVRPYNNGSQAVFSFGSNSFGNSMDINFTESNTVTFDVNATDANDDDLNYTWYYNGVYNGTQRPRIHTYDYASNGQYTIKVVVNDPFFEETSFQWNLTVTNLNRQPQLLNDLDNLTGSQNISGTKTFQSYFSRYGSDQRFYDADDDSNNNSEIDGDETSALTYNATSCLDQVLATVATFTYSGADLTVIPVKLGLCNVTFTAIDSAGEYVSSNKVRVNVTGLNAETGSSTTTTTVSSGGGGGTNTVVVPLSQEVNNPTPLKIIAPGEVVIYRQKVITVPIIIESNWTEPLLGITLEATTNNTDVELNLSQDYFNSLNPLQRENVTLTITNFREGGPYEILITGRVDDPEYEDTQLILINSIEAANDGDTYETKISFARDFFDENKECQELNEVLNQAEIAATNLDYKQAIDYVDAAINGCKHLVSELAAAETQNPSYIKTLRNITKDNIIVIVISAISLFVVGLGFFFTRKQIFE